MVALLDKQEGRSFSPGLLIKHRHKKIFQFAEYAKEDFDVRDGLDNPAD